MSKRKATDSKDEAEDEEIMPPKPKRIKRDGDNLESGIQITDISMDSLFQVFSKLNFWHHNRIRATCKYFRQVHDYYLGHAFRKALHEFSLTEPNSVPAAILYSIKQATIVYISEGYETIFYNSLLPVLRRNYQTPFEIETRDLKALLTAFFITTDNKMENPSSHRALVLYMLTMLNLLKSFRAYEFNVIETYRNLKIIIVIPDIWLGTLFRRPLPGKEKCNSILVILGLLLVGSRTGRAMKYVYEHENEMYLCGTDAAGDPLILNSKTEFEINVKASSKIRTLFKEWMNRLPDQPFDLPENVGVQWFQFNVKITCKSAAHWGCPPKKILHITPKS